MNGAVMQLDVVQKSIIGVVGLAGLLAFVVPTNLAPKPAVEEEITPPVVKAAPENESTVAPKEVALDAIDVDQSEGFGEPSISGLPFDEERKGQPENSAQQSTNIISDGVNSGPDLNNIPPLPPSPTN
jgi:hypothetical protein